MDAATVENVKWMMTYLNDCKESNVGQLFMAVQTYVSVSYTHLDVYKRQPEKSIAQLEREQMERLKQKAIDGQLMLDE